MPGPVLDPSAILYEDDDLIAVNKPPGLPSQVTLDPRRPHLEMLVRELILMRGETEKVYLGMHQRLDRDTSGVIVFAKTKRANPGLAIQVANHQIQKTYWAIANGQAAEVEWQIKNHLGKVPKKSARDPMRQHSVKSGGDFAETAFRVLAQGKEAFLVGALPRTGRMHQIRVHLAEGGNAILGDDLYASEKVARAAERLMLHARKLELTHPISGVQLNLDAPPPKDFVAVLKRLGLEPSH